MNMKKNVFSLLVASLTLASFQARAGLITFEAGQIPGLNEGDTVFDQYDTAAFDHVKFYNATNLSGSPILGKLDAPAAGWTYDVTGEADTFAPGEGASNGEQFISDVMGGNTTGTSVLVVTYGTSVKELSFDLIDIDGQQLATPAPEQYTIKFYDAAMTLLNTQTITAGDPGTGDGVVTHIGYSSGSNNIARLEVIGTKNVSGASFGLAFDNFSTDRNLASVPAPGVLSLLSIGLAGLGAARRKNRR